MQEFPRFPPDFPKTVIRTCPRSRQRREDGTNLPPPVVFNHHSGVDFEPGCCTDCAIDVELELLMGRISDTYRVRALIAFQRRDLALRKVLLAFDPIHDLQLTGKGLTGSDVFEPLHEV